MAKMKTASTVGEYLERIPDFARPICRKLREVIRKADGRLVEEIKWGAPSYGYRGMVCSFNAFKEHVGLWFHKGSLLEDPKRILIKTNAEHMRSLRFTKAEQVDPKTLAAYIREAAALNEKGVKPASAKGPVVVPPALEKALEKHPRAKAFFESLAPSHRREYARHIAEAKKPETVERRVAKTIAELSRGRRPNEKYRGKK